MVLICLWTSTIAQEYAIEDILVADMLVLEFEQEAEEVLNKLWQVGFEAEVEEGVYVESGIEHIVYYIELQDVSILDVEIKNEDGRYERVFDRKLRKKLIRVELTF